MTVSAWATRTPVSFYLPERGALAGADPTSLEPDRDWAVFGTGVYVWILQTYLRLRAAGAPVSLDQSAPAQGIVVTHADYLDRLLTEAPSPADLIVVSTRSDRPAQILADVEIVQNASTVEDYQIHIPSWSQPGLVPRSGERGTCVEQVAFIGALKQLHPELRDPAWARELAARGFRWDARAITFSGNDVAYTGHGWNDYSTVDVVVALRPPSLWDVGRKPAAKLQNAWIAGVPAILSPEEPYRELRRSALDYIEARSGSDVLAALERLRGEPGLYRAMVEHGRVRAEEFSVARLVDRWRQVLWEEVPARAGARRHRLLARARDYRALARRVRRKWRTLQAPIAGGGNETTAGR